MPFILTITQAPIAAQTLTEDAVTHQPQVSELNEQLQAVADELLILQYGTIEDSDELEVDLSHLVAGKDLTLTLMLRTLSPAASEPILANLGNYPIISWVIHVENTSDDYQVADTIIKQVQIQEERDNIVTYRPLHFEATDVSGYNIIPQPHPNPLLIAPNEAILLFVIQPIDNPFSLYYLTSLAGNQELKIPAFEQTQANLIQQAITSTNTIHTEESFQQLITDLQTQYTQLETKLQEAKLVAHDLFLEEQDNQHKNSLKQTLSDNLTLVEHGQQLTGNEQYELYWIFETSNLTDDHAYAARALWDLQAVQALDDNYQDLLGATLTPVLKTPAGNYMPTSTPLEHSLVPTDWTGHFKVSIQRVANSYDYYLDYQGTKLNSYKD